MDCLSNMFLCVYWVGMYLYVFVDGLLVFGKSRELVPYALNFISRRIPYACQFLQKPLFAFLLPAFI